MKTLEQLLSNKPKGIPVIKISNKNKEEVKQAILLALEQLAEED